MLGWKTTLTQPVSGLIVDKKDNYYFVFYENVKL